jgi:hypothetical protein
VSDWAKWLRFSSSFFPPQAVAIWERIAEPRGYGRKLRPSHLILALSKALVLRMPSLEAIGRAFSDTLGTSSKSTLSHGLRGLMSLRVVRMMSRALGEQCRPQRGSIVPIDSMALTVQATQRSRAAKLNNRTRGVGVLWQLNLDAPAGTCPVKILRIMHGAWNDSHQIRQCELEPNGPIYVMDRGFWSLAAMNDWLKAKVRFVIRAKAQQCRMSVLQSKGSSRKIGSVTVVSDCIAIVGVDPRTQLKLRIVHALRGKEDLILASSELGASAKELLAIYRKRWAIERFHKLVKQTLGLAHLYSFQANGLELLLHVAFILAALTYLSIKGSGKAQDQIALIRAVIKGIRAALCITEWKPNTCTHRWKKKMSKNH